MFVRLPKSKVFLKNYHIGNISLKLKVQTSKYYLHQLKVQIYGSTPVVVFAAVGRYRGGRGAAAASAERVPVEATAAGGQLLLLLDGEAVLIIALKLLQRRAAAAAAAATAASAGRAAVAEGRAVVGISL